MAMNKQEAIAELRRQRDELFEQRDALIEEFGVGSTTDEVVIRKLFKEHQKQRDILDAKTRTVWSMMCLIQDGADPLMVMLQYKGQ